MDETSKTDKAEKTPDQQLHSLLSKMFAFIRSKELVEEIDGLIKRGANVNGEKSDGSLLLMCVNNNNMVAMKELLSRGANPHLEFKQKKGGVTTLLHIAAARKDTGRILLMLLAAGLDPHDKKDEQGMSAKALSTAQEGLSQVFSYPLHFAVKSKDAGLCSEFLRRGYNPQTTDHKGDSPYEMAKRGGCSELTALFDAAKAMRAIDDLLRESSNDQKLSAGRTP